MTIYPNFKAALNKAANAMRFMSMPVITEKWQGVDISGRPEAQMREVIGYTFKVPMIDYDLERLQEDVQPHLPWADEHFEERVCGYPMNPGESWKNWPWANKADEFRDEKGRFEINYMERFWAASHFDDTPRIGERSALTGIRGRPYGDLGNILALLESDPTTRQAYLPIYFPEDTGAGGRVPCSLGYHWIMRHGFFHVHYPIRSCDFYRHFNDDIYLAVRLTMWLRDELHDRVGRPWNEVRLGHFSMWIGSLHLFVNDYRRLFGNG